MLCIATASCLGHGAMLSPAPRNAFDRNTTQYASSSLCNCGNRSNGCGTANNNRAAMQGQSCFWFSQGCFIGCAECTGTDQQPKGMNKKNESTGPHSSCKRSAQPAGSSLVPTLPKECWTMNRAAVEDSVEDIYRFHPWRAPGSAPVIDPCGQAGGTTPRYQGPGHTFFKNESFNGSRMIGLGDFGSKVLPPGPSAATWHVDSSVEVKWGLRFNHGGGYQYRLCPATEPLTEDCFQRYPLEFNRSGPQIEWRNGTRLAYKGVYVDEGVIPVGVTWAMNPIPLIAGSHPGCANANGSNAPDAKDADGKPCCQFDPPCAEDGSDSSSSSSSSSSSTSTGTGTGTHTGTGSSGKSSSSSSFGGGWGPVPGTADPHDVMGECSGNWIDGAIVDQVIIPPDLAPGAYVLGWRWDCEQTSQVWASCADVTLLAAD